jgi:hypothetical protein
LTRWYSSSASRCAGRVPTFGSCMRPAGRGFRAGNASSATALRDRKESAARPARRSGRSGISRAAESLHKLGRAAGLPGVSGVIGPAHATRAKLYAVTPRESRPKSLFPVRPVPLGDGPVSASANPNAWVAYPQISGNCRRP